MYLVLVVIFVVFHGWFSLISQGITLRRFAAFRLVRQWTFRSPRNTILCFRAWFARTHKASNRVLYERVHRHHVGFSPASQVTCSTGKRCFHARRWHYPKPLPSSKDRLTSQFLLSMLPIYNFLRDTSFRLGCLGSLVFWLMFSLSWFGLVWLLALLRSTEITIEQRSDLAIKKWFIFNLFYNPLFYKHPRDAYRDQYLPRHD